MKFEYECWKCPKWHETTARDAWAGWRQGYARPAVSIGKLRLTIPDKRGVRIANGGRLWLIPLPFGYGLLIGATPRLWVGKWEHTIFEFKDHLQGYGVAEFRQYLKRARNAK